MFLDGQNQFSDSQALTVTALSTNVIDLSLIRAIGVGEPLCVVFNVEVTALVSDDDEDYTFGLEVASAAAMDAGQQEIAQLQFESGTPGAPALDADLLVAGYSFTIPVPPLPNSIANRYLGVRYTLAGTSMGITVSAHLQPQNQIQMVNNYADGIAII